MRRLIAAALLALAVAAVPARADLLSDPRYAEGAKFRMQQFIRRGVDPAEAEAIFRKLTSLDAGPWVAEWTRLAEPWEAKARELEAQGQTAEARDAYLQAVTRYSIAKFPVINHPAKQAAYRKEIELYLRAAKYFDVPLERVAIPFEGTAIIGYLRKPPGVARPPVVIVTGGIDVYKEDRDVSDVLNVGLAAFSMDMPGAGESPVWYTPDADRLYSTTIDYLQGRADLDGSRVAILGRSYGGYWGGKMAYVEATRVKAAVMWGGPIHYTFQRDWLEYLKTERKYLWPLLDSMIYAHHVTDYAELVSAAPAMSLKTEGWLDKPSAPMLALNGEKDPWISPRDVLVVAETGPSPKALRLYPDGTHMGDDRGSTGMVARWLRDQLAR